jgi:hypothetical protein
MQRRFWLLLLLMVQSSFGIFKSQLVISKVLVCSYLLFLIFFYRSYNNGTYTRCQQNLFSSNGSDSFTKCITRWYYASLGMFKFFFISLQLRICERNPRPSLFSKANPKVCVMFISIPSISLNSPQLLKMGLFRFDTVSPSIRIHFILEMGHAIA